jgi:hypothetical protein
MSEQVRSVEQEEAQVPEKCMQCRFLDKETDHMLAVPQVHLYCRAPMWHPSHWTCKPPAGVARA